MGVFQKSILNRVCQLLAIRAHTMAPRTSQWLKERASDTPTKGLLWNDHREAGRLRLPRMIGIPTNLVNRMIPILIAFKRLIIVK